MVQANFLWRRNGHRGLALRTWGLAQVVWRWFLRFGLVLTVPAIANANEVMCETGHVVIAGNSERDMREGCAAVVLASRFFDATGLAMPKGLRIFIEDVPEESRLGSDEIGIYDATRAAIHVRGFEATLTATQIHPVGFGRVSKRSQWRAYLVHELAHAAVHARCNRLCPSRAIHEYVAAVAQVSSLPADELEELLARHDDLAAFERADDITETYYALNPHYFAVKCYKHFHQLPAPRTFLHDALGTAR